MCKPPAFYRACKEDYEKIICISPPPRATVFTGTRVFQTLALAYASVFLAKHIYSLEIKTVMVVGVGVGEGSGGSSSSSSSSSSNSSSSSSSSSSSTTHCIIVGSAH